MSRTGIPRSGLSYRAAVAGRVVLAALGGYGVAALCTALLSLTLPLVRSEAVTVATLASFAIMVGAVVYVFAARSLARAALGLGAVGLLLGGGLWLVNGFA
ncbi:iron transporter [Methylobacterium planeticum]|uniref:Iron transporter n=1 Tax=Methylobacterium planeticum TaxID=2615211 RepID=A0A6N6MLP7_9HYPH|nr:iron transporter [Methylobacterium planeticum]KAB1070994.1 iron transporter [Methylobacterium planeticum]